MDMDSDQVSTSRRVQIPRAVTRTGYFLLHLLEMCVVMCAGTGILAALLHWGGTRIGYPNPTRQFPETSALMLAIFLTLLMIAWMRLRGHDLRLTLEMASTSMIALIPLFVMNWLSILPRSRLYGLECGLACVLMLIPMLYRIDHYTGSHAAHQYHTQAAQTVIETSCHSE